MGRRVLGAVTGAAALAGVLAGWSLAASSPAARSTGGPHAAAVAAGAAGSAEGEAAVRGAGIPAPAEADGVAQVAAVTVDGAIAAADRWTTTGGTAARTRATHTRPVRGPIAEAWRYEVDGEIEGEPLCWDARLVLAVERRQGRRVLEVLDLIGGPPAVIEKEFRTTVPIVPALGEGAIVVRSQETQWTALRLGARRFVHLWTVGPKAAVGPPLVLGEEVYGVAGGALERRDLGHGQLEWSAAGPFVGAPSVRGDTVWAIATDEFNGRRGWSAVQVDRASGRELSRTLLGHAIDGDGRPGQVLVLEDLALVYAPGGDLEIPGVGRSATFGLTLPPPTGLSFSVPGASLYHRVPAVAWAAGWIGAADVPERGPTWLATGMPDLSTVPDGLREGGAPGATRGRPRGVAPGEERITILADAGSHPELAQRVAPPAVAGHVAYLGGTAVDLDTLRILWTFDEALDATIIPARDTALCLVRPSTLVALRAAERVADKAFAAPGVASVDLSEAVAVLSDGTVLRGALELRPAEAQIVQRAERKLIKHPLAHLLLLLGPDGGVLEAAGERALVRGGDLLVRDELARGLAALADEGRGTHDAVLIGRLVREAQALGAEGREIDRAEKALASLAQRPRAPDTRGAAVIAEREVEVRARAAAVYWDLAAGLPEGTPERVLFALLRRLFARDPAYPAAVAHVRALLPADLAPPEPFDALDWLAFVEATRRHPVRLVPRPASELGITRSQTKLGQALTTWRPDLVAFESEHLLIVTPLARPGAISRCLAMGELVCGALNEMFAGGEHDRQLRRPLLLHLYESQEEYLEESTGPGEAGSGLSWSAGHYDPADNVSRIYLPTDGDWDSVMETYAHELTHHWVQMRCPYFTTEEARRLNPRAPGYWIVEGFAGMVEEFRFDVRGDAWSSENPRSRRLDLVANAGQAARLPWKSVFALSQLEFHGMQDRGHATVPSTWFLGLHKIVGARQQFYNQAGAACRYLYHADGGAQREALLRYLADYYTGKTEGLDVAEVFGLEPDELGKRVRAYAQAAQGE